VLAELAHDAVGVDGVDQPDPRQDVEDCGICTRCEGGTFFSHRGEGPETGRQAGIVTAA